MSYCSYCNYFAPTNSRYQRHLNTNKHARNFMLVDAGIQELIPPDQPPTNNDDLPDLIVANDDDDLPDLIPIEPLCDEIDDNNINTQTIEPQNDKSTSVDNIPELIDVSLDTFDLDFLPIDETTRELNNSSYNIISHISQFFDNYPYAFHILHAIGFIGMIFFKSNQDKPPLVDSK